MTRFLLCLVAVLALAAVAEAGHRALFGASLDEHVGRLEIAVHQPGPVGAGHSRADPAEQEVHLERSEAPVTASRSPARYLDSSAGSACHSSVLLVIASLPGIR